MDKFCRSICPSLGELLDRLTINQLREVFDYVNANKLSYSYEIGKIEQDIDLFITANKLNFDIYFIRLIVALSQINLHIWKTKDTMQMVPNQFKEAMKLAHQLNGIRNQIKNQITEVFDTKNDLEKKTNLSTDELRGWDFSILKGKDLLKPIRADSPINSNRQYKYLLTDLIDLLTIEQIKEVLLPERQRLDSRKRLSQLSYDIAFLMEERKIKPAARLIRLIALLAQANLHVWYNKDKMWQESENYYELLEFAQEINGLRNFARNLLTKEFNEAEISNQKADFLDYGGGRWYSGIIKDIKRPVNMPILTLSLDDFARLFGTSKDDFFPDCLEIISNKDFRYKKLDIGYRDEILNKILKQIDSDELWVSGPDKQDIWEKGWLENLRDYEKYGDSDSLIPKFIQSHPVLRLDRDYIQPLSSHFEFNFVDVYRRWVFQKYLKDAGAIYEFGCGSCQHLLVLAKLFPEKPLHGLDWALSSSRIIRKMVQGRKWNITAYRFDLYSPDENMLLANESAVLTIGTMEQLGEKFEPFLQYLLSRRPFIVVHIETIRELYDDEYLADYLAIRYDTKRNYLTGYLDRLKRLEQEQKIEIIRTHRMFFGSMYHDSYSLIVWRPK